MKDKKTFLLDFYPILSGVINVVLLCSIICFLLLNGIRKIDSFGKTVLLGSSLWLVNALFTISASSAALRFQSFPIFLTVIFATLLIDWMVCHMKMSEKKHMENSKHKTEEKTIQSLNLQ